MVLCAPNPPPDINYSDTASVIQKTFYDVEIPNNICFDINADKTGAINPAHIAQVKAIREILNTSKIKKK